MEKFGETDSFQAALVTLLHFSRIRGIGGVFWTSGENLAGT